VDLLRVSKALERHQSVVTILTDNSFIIGVLYKNLLVFCAVMYESTVYCFAVCQSFYWTNIWIFEWANRKVL